MTEGLTYSEFRALRLHVCAAPPSGRKGIIAMLFRLARWMLETGRSTGYIETEAAVRPSNLELRNRRGMEQR